MPRDSRRIRQNILVALVWLLAAVLTFVLTLLMLTSVSTTPQSDDSEPSGMARTGDETREFTISGSVDAVLWPGEATAVDIEIGNPRREPLTVISLEMRPLSDDAACPASSFRVTPMKGPVVVPADASATLSALGVPTTDWPAIELVDLPYAQDGCRDREIAIDYIATGIYR